MKLTTYLPTTLSPTTATTHPFLRRSGLGQICKPLLSQWLSQDRLYAQSYVRFIGHLLSKINLPLSPSPSAESKGTTAEQTMTILIAAVTNIQTELKFFETTAAEYGLGLNSPPTHEKEFGAAPITRAYIDLFMSAGSAGSSLLEGMVVLWATEVCYLNAWRYAGGFLGERVEGKEDEDGGALREKFIPNWSSGEFEAFVVRIGEVMDGLAEEVLGALGEGEREVVIGRCVRWWKQVIWLEERFWPNVE